MNREKIIKEIRKYIIKNIYTNRVQCTRELRANLENRYKNCKVCFVVYGVMSGLVRNEIIDINTITPFSKSIAIIK